MYSPVGEDETVVLPIEIWEKILLHLFGYSPKAFLRAAKVCVQWRHLAITICEKVCRSKLADNIKEELFETQVTHRYYSRKYRTENGEPNGEDWLRIFALYQETRLNSSNQLLPLEIFENTSTYIEDPFLLLATYHPSEEETLFKTTSVTIYNALDLFSEDNTADVCGSPFNDNNIYSSFAIKDEIYDIQFLLLSSPVLLVRTREFDDCLQWIVVQKGSRPKQPSRGMIESNCINSKHMSTKGSFVLTIDDLTIGKHKLYYASLDEKRLEVDFALYGTFIVGNPVFTSKLLRDHIKVNSCDGHILLFELPPHLKGIKSNLNKKFPSNETNLNNHQIISDDSTDTSSSCHSIFKLFASSNFAKDLRYPNKNIFTQDWTFTSTAISSSLLYYWHMDRGREYSWLVGLTVQLTADPKENKKWLATQRSRILYNIIIGEETTEEVTTLQVTRGLLACGTSEGQVLIYRLQEEAVKKKGNLDFLKGAPWINVPMIKREIRAISVLWTTSGLIVAVQDVDKRSKISILLSTE